MPFETLPCVYRPVIDVDDESKYSQFWEIRVKIESNAISEAVKILSPLLQKQKLPWKYLNFTPKNDAIDEFAKATKGIYTGSDRDQSWKTLCIYLPDDRRLDPKDHYEQFILSIWEALENANIPLVYATPIGDQPIKVENKFPSPFQ